MQDPHPPRHAKPALKSVDQSARTPESLDRQRDRLKELITANSAGPREANSRLADRLAQLAELFERREEAIFQAIDELMEFNAEIDRGFAVINREVDGMIEKLKTAKNPRPVETAAEPAQVPAE